MNYCAKCGCELEDDAVFCPNCGAQNVSGDNQETYRINNNPLNQRQNAGNNMFGGFQNVRGNYGFTQQNQASPQYGKDEDVFVDPNEKLIARLGGGWIVNLAVLRKIRRVNAILTDRRCYLQGNFFADIGNKMQQTKTEKIVNVEDINATRFRYTRDLKYFWLTILFAVISLFLLIFFIAVSGGEAGAIFGGLCSMLPFAGVAAFMAVKYFLSKRTFFYIEYAGGYIQFEIHISDYAQVQLFAKQIHRVKDYSRAALRNDLASRIKNNG